MPMRRSSLALTAMIVFLALPAAADVTIHCLYVGQADATLIQSSSGQAFLFDGGDNGDGDDIIVPYLASLGITTLDYMAASHYHSDHVGGLDEVYAAVGVSQAVYDRGWNYSTATYTSYANTVAAKRHTAVDGQIIDLGDGVTVTVIALNGNGQVASPYDSDTHENEYCLALLVECGDFDFLVSGDLTGGYSSEADIETSVGAEVSDIEVYQVNHHGSYTSSNSAFLASITPEVGIVSVPISSSYGHPAQEALDRMSAVGVYLYQTAQGSASTYPAGMRTIVNTVSPTNASARHIVITSDGYGEYFVDGDQWTMDEPSVDVPALASLRLLGNAPNPFNPATEIRFETRDGGPVRLTIYDLAGRLLSLDAFEASPGLVARRWEGRDTGGRPLSSGVYMYRVQTNEGAATGRMTLAR